MIARVDARYSDLLVALVSRQCICVTDGSLNWDATKSLYLELLMIFEKTILPTHECVHTQFLLFYICSLKQVSRLTSPQSL